MLHLLMVNAELNESMTQILQIFPEGVIIQSNEIDESAQWKTIFANDAFKDVLFNSIDRIPAINMQNVDHQTVEFLNNPQLLVKIIPEDNKVEDEEQISIQDLLSRQVRNLPKVQTDLGYISQMIERADENEINTKFEDLDTKYYTIKTMEVTWKNNIKSFMHLFADTTNVIKLEKERTHNKCQKVMFASVSHEFRTPLNAFSNSLFLIDNKLSIIRNNTRPILGGNDEVIKSYE